LRLGSGENLSDDQMIRAFLATTKKNAAEVLGQPHVGDDVKSVIKDLLQICQNFQDLTGSATSQSADVRVLKKKFDQSKSDLRAIDAKLTAAKQLMLSVASEVEIVIKETISILKRHQTPATDPDFISGNKIRAASKKVIEAILKVTAMPGAPPET
jgi:hypothetical protein